MERRIAAEEGMFVGQSAKLWGAAKIATEITKGVIV